MRIRLTLALLALALVPAFSGGSLALGAEAPQWRLEQPKPPELVSGEQPGTPIGLGRIGDIEFWAPNRGLLITHGNGSTVPSGVWAYNGAGWHELANVCGATDGRIAWAGPDEFWTVSDGRPGQAANANGVLPPLEDNTLCRFSGGRVATSYASLGFQASSYQPMHAAACVSSSDCWFAGDPLPAPQLGAFHLHWNGSALEAEPNTRVDQVQDMRVFQGSLLESIALPLESSEGEETEEEILHPSILQEISPEGVSPVFRPLHPRSGANRILPEYAPPSPETPEYPFGSFPQALDFLHLSAAEGSLWAAAGPVAKPPQQSAPGQLTVLREAGGVWSQVLGPETEQTASSEQEHTGKADPPNLREAVVNSIAAEPGTSDAWLALDTRADVEFPNPTAVARVVHVAADGSVLAEEQLPSAAERSEGVGPKGAAYKLTCPAQNDCWLTTTEGWLFHLSEAGARTLPTDTDPAFNGPLITVRPLDEGLPQVESDAPPLDDSGLEESQASSAGQLTKATAPNIFATVTLPLLSNVHTRLVHGTTLELSFHLSAKARVRLVALRHSHVVAKTPSRTFKAGKRSLQLHLDRNRWPTKLNLQTHPLAPLPTASSRSSGVETIGTLAVFPNQAGSLGLGSLR